MIPGDGQCKDSVFSRAIAASHTAAFAGSDASSHTATNGSDPAALKIGADPTKSSTAAGHPNTDPVVITQRISPSATPLAAGRS